MRSQKDRDPAFYTETQEKGNDLNPKKNNKSIKKMIKLKISTNSLSSSLIFFFKNLQKLNFALKFLSKSE